MRQKLVQSVEQDANGKQRGKKKSAATGAAILGVGALALLLLPGCGGGGSVAQPQALEAATITIPAHGVRPVMANGVLQSVTLRQDGSAHYVTSKGAGDLALAPALASRFYRDLNAAMPLSGLSRSAPPCYSPNVMPPTVDYQGQQTDFFCSGFADPQSKAGALYADTAAILDAVVQSDPYTGT